MLRGSRFILFAGLLAAISLPSMAAETRRDNFGDWGFICSTPDNGGESAVESCNLFQTALLNNEQAGEGAQPQRLLLTRIGYLGETERPVLLVTAPLGILLPRGISVSVEGQLEEPVRFALQRCDAGGCLGYIAMTDELVAAFKKGTKATVSFVDPQQRSINVPLSLKGFTKGMAELDASLD